MLGTILILLVLGITTLVSLSVAVRVRRDSAERERERFRARWEPLLYGRMSGDGHALPRLPRAERLMFLILWLRLLRYVRDEAAEALMQAARDLGLSGYVLRLLESRSDWRRVIAMQAAGALRLKEAREPLISKIAQNRPKSSVAAVRALLQIDPQQGLTGLRQVLRHPRWSPMVMIDVVKAAGPQATEMLAAMVLSALPGRACRLVRLIELTEERSVLPALRERLQFSRDEEEIAVIVHALGRLGGAEERIMVLAFIAHDHWLVRMQTAWALGALGIEQDCDLLLPLLRDYRWWVRYRAAQSVLRLKGAAALSFVSTGGAGPDALDMVKRVIAEGA